MGVEHVRVIEADELDEQTIAEIDELIRRRSGGEKSIRTVSAPRQKLEELFLGIVEDAQNEKASTSGAMHGGSTASFLKGDESEHEQGSALIDSLLSDAQIDAPVSQSASQPSGQADTPASGDPVADSPEKSTEDSSLIGTLMGEGDDSGETEQAPQADSGSSGAQPAADVDLGVIGSLLDDETDSDTDQDDDQSKESHR